MKHSGWRSAVSCLIPAVAVGSVDVLTVRINTGYCAPPGGSRSTVGFPFAGNGTISGFLPNIATGSVLGSGPGSGVGTTTGSRSGPSVSSSPLACPIRNNTIYTNDFGTEYNAFCGRDLIGDAAISSHTDSFEKCLDFCDIFGGCAGVTYSSPNSSSQANCLPFNTFTGYAEGPPRLLSGVSVNGPVINGFANRILCPTLDNQTVIDPFGDSYLIGCDKTLSGNADIAPTVLKTLAACLLYCSLGDGCSAVTFTGYPPPTTGAGVSYNCFPRTSTVSGLKKRQNAVVSSKPGSQIAVRIFQDQDGFGVISSGLIPAGITSTQTTEPVASGPAGVSATGPGGSLPGSGNSTQTGGSSSPTGTGTTGSGAGDSTKTGGLGGASGTGTTVSGNATGTPTGVPRPTPSNILSCSGSNNTQYTDEFNTSYNITCGLDIIGSNAVASHADTFDKCISFCDILSGCAGVTYQTSSAITDSTCHPYSSFNGYRSIPGPSGLLAAIPAKGGLVNNTFSYDQLCPGSVGQNFTDRYGVTYTIGCNEVISGTDLSSTVLRSLNACLLYCSLFSEGCAAVTFTGYPPGLVPSGAIAARKRQTNQTNCFPKSSTGPVEGIVPQTGASYAKRVSPGPAIGSGNSTTGPGASSTPEVPGNSASGASGNSTVVAGASSTSSITGPNTPSGSGNSTVDAKASSTSSITGPTTPSGSVNSAVDAKASSTSSITGPTTPSGSSNSTVGAKASSASGIAGKSTSAATLGGSSNSGVPSLGNPTSGLQPPVSTTPGRSPPNPSSIRGPLGNSTSSIQPTGSATSFFNL